MTEINKLKLSRRNAKGQLTRTLAMMDNLIGNGDEDVQILQKYITKAEEQFDRIEQKHGELIDLVEDQSQFEEEEKWMTECEKGFIQVLVRAKRVVDQGIQFSGNNQQQLPSASSSPLHSRVSQVPTQPVSTGTSQFRPPFTPTHQQDPSSGASTASSNTAPRMARMKFPTFSGDVREYKRFKELFQHCTRDLSEMECFFQLTEAMTNPREKGLIKGCISVTRAWEVLDGYYGDEDKIVDSLLKDLENLISYEVKGKVNLPAMQQFVQTLQTFETQAETVGLAGELNSKIMLSHIRQKLPEEHRLAFLKSVRDDINTQDTLQGLNRWLYCQLLLLDKAKSASSSEPPAPYKRQTQSSNAAAVKTSPRNDRNVPKCALHVDSNTHFLKTCNKFRDLSLKEKYDIMEQNNICTRCGHNNCAAGRPPFEHKSCQFPFPCKIYTCGSDTHFSAICPVVFGNRDQSHSDSPAFKPTTVTAGVKTVTNTHQERLHGTLPTVMGYLRHGNNRQLVRILLDGGSQASLVREGLFTRTGQDYYQDHDLTLVGGAKIHRKLRVLDCSIEDVEGNWSYPLSITEIDQPCGEAPVVRPEDLQLHDHLRGVDIQVAPSEVVDVLLGVDNTHLMIWQDHILGEKPDEPVAVRCPFGWFIQGGQERSPCSSQMSNYVRVTAIGPLEQNMANLSESPVKPCTLPFQTTFVDYLGPINVMVNRNTTVKGYCAVFNCATTRAVDLSLPEWETILCQISSFINSRPVTAMSSSPQDHPTPTPNHFLIGRGDLPSSDVPCEPYGGAFWERRELCNALIDKFWTRWHGWTTYTNSPHAQRISNHPTIWGKGTSCWSSARTTDEDIGE